MNNYEFYIGRYKDVIYFFIYNKITNICHNNFKGTTFNSSNTKTQNTNNLYDMSEKEMIISYELRKLTPLEMLIYNIRVIDDKNVRNMGK